MFNQTKRLKPAADKVKSEPVMDMDMDTDTAAVMEAATATEPEAVTVTATDSITVKEWVTTTEPRSEDCTQSCNFRFRVIWRRFTLEYELALIY